MNTLKRTLTIALFCLLTTVPAKALGVADVVSMQHQRVDEATIINLVAQQKLSHPPTYRDILILRSRHASENFLQFLCSPAAYADRSTYQLGSAFDLQPLDLSAMLPRIQYYVTNPPPPPPPQRPHVSQSKDMPPLFELLFKMLDDDDDKKRDRHPPKHPPQPGRKHDSRDDNRRDPPKKR